MPKCSIQKRKSSQKEWTRSAIECYELGCQCEACFLYHTYFKNTPHKCKMYETVKRLIRKAGIPLVYEKKIRQKKNNFKERYCKT